MFIASFFFVRGFQFIFLVIGGGGGGGGGGVDYLIV